MLRNILQLSSNQVIEENQNLMNKRDFTKFMQIENEKAKINQKLNDYVAKYADKRKIILLNKNKGVRLQATVEKMKTNPVTFTGNIFDVKRQLQEYQDKMNRYQTKIYKLMREERIEVEIVEEAKKKFDYETLTTVMDVEIFENKMEENKRKKIDAKDEKWKKFLKRVALLPDDVLCEIQSYFMYETKAVLLVQKYEPLKLFHSLNRSLLNKCIYQVYRKYYYSTTHQNLKMKMTTIWKALYKDSHIVERIWDIPPLKKLKTFIQYLFILFCEYGRPQYCFELYRDIIILKKKLDQPVVIPFEFGLRSTQAEIEEDDDEPQV
jgi:hypothetical protein